MILRVLKRSFLTPLDISGRGEGLKVNPLCLSNQASIKSPTGLGEPLGSSTCGDLGESVTFQEGMEASCSFPIPCLTHLFNLAFSELFCFIINQ